ncbi:DUF1850 domain-containing protein [Ignatzschineria sp. LJL83]
MSKRRNKHASSISLVTMMVVLCTTLLLLISLMGSSQRLTLIITPSFQCKIENPQFALSWIHSVDKTPWIEQYERKDAGFLLTKTQFKTFGAGVPHDGKVIESNDSMIHYQINQFMPEINWVIDHEVYSTILLPNNLPNDSPQGNPWEIYREFDRYSEIQIRNQPFNFWQRVFTRNCHES